MKNILLLSLILTTGVAFGGQPKRKVAQSTDPLRRTVGEFNFSVSRDYDSGMDLMTVTDSKEETVCTYLSDAGESERFLWFQPETQVEVPKVIAFTRVPNRFFVTYWSLQSSSSPFEVKILDANQKGGTCVFAPVTKEGNRFLGQNIFWSYKEKGTLKVTEVSAEDDDSTNFIARVTECHLDSKKGLICKTGKPSPYQQGNP